MISFAPRANRRLDCRFLAHYPAIGRSSLLSPHTKRQTSIPSGPSYSRTRSMLSSNGHRSLT